MFKVFVKYWEGENREIKKCGGLLGASSYINAMEKVIDHSGENIISVYTLKNGYIITVFRENRGYTVKVSVAAHTAY